jgi:predicted TIM-barrel fold metal-dependent hydrolase
MATVEVGPGTINRGKTVERKVTLLPDPQPEALYCPIISPDDHAFEPADTFTSRVPARFVDQVPRVETDDEGFPYWLLNGNKVSFSMGNSAVGRPTSEWDQGKQKWEDMRRGIYDVDARVADMDLCGVWAQLCFPSIPWGFAGNRFVRMVDPEVGLASVRAYNDWHLNEWCAKYPDRFISCQVAWLGDPKVAAQEIIANAALGFRSVTFIENPEVLGLPSIYSLEWDPFFRACEETGTVINLHVGSSGVVHSPSKDSTTEVITALFPMHGVFSIVDWIFARIPLRFPNLKIVLSEAGVSWVPMVIERLDRAVRSTIATSDVWKASDPTPVELLHRNFWYTSIEDPAAFRMLDLIGVDKVMVETDYPHRDSTWPECQAMIRQELQHLDAATVRKLCYENAADLYRHPLPPTEMLERSEIAAAQHA